MDLVSQSLTEYIPRNLEESSLADLLEMTACVEQNKPLSQALQYALMHGTSVGGARPKALIQADKKFFIAKFSLSSDPYNLIKAEYVAMRLAKLVGIGVILGD